MLAVLPAALWIRLAICSVFLRVFVEQCLEHRPRADHHRWRRGCVVLHQEHQQGQQECHSQITSDGLPLPPGLCRLWRLHRRPLSSSVRYLLKYYEQQAKAQKNRIVVLILKVLQCLIWCFEKCIKFLNKNAYIQIALMGTNFCTSAKKAFFLILRNALRFGTVAILGSMIHVIGIMFITAGTAVLGYFTLSGLHPAMAPAVPMIIYIILGYVVGRLFTSIFELAVDTTLQCFLCCEEMQIAEMGPEGFVPSQLGPWLDKSQPPEKASQKKVMEEEAGQM